MGDLSRRLRDRNYSPRRYGFRPALRVMHADRLGASPFPEWSSALKNAASEIGAGASSLLPIAPTRSLSTAGWWTESWEPTFSTGWALIGGCVPPGRWIYYR